MTIKNFWKEVKTNGVKITEYKDKYKYIGFFGYNGKTYCLEMNKEGKISRETPATWKSIVLNMQNEKED